ncbi:MAG: hypothetical protein GF310_14060 [candidate division Zixibacteria bacterium]|nr:hypothetical protein [candidate division Zixibacteria bacterium]
MTGIRYISLFTLVALIGLLLFPNETNAESNGAESQYSKYSDYSWSFQLAISDRFTLSPYSGSMISATYHKSKKTALRFGLTFDFEKETNSWKRSKEEININSGIKTERNLYGIRFIILYIINSDLKKNVRPYLGFGPQIGFFYHESIYNRYIPSSDKKLLKDWQILIGCRANLGVEYYFNENISLIAEYGGSIKLWGRDIEEDNNYPIRPQSSAEVRLGIEPLPVNFGISVHF